MGDWKAESILERTTRTNSTITQPPGIADGDPLLILFEIAGVGTPPVPPPPTGFDAITVTGGDSFPATLTDGSFVSNLYAFGRVADNESGDYVVTHSSAITGAYMLVADKGALVNTFLPAATIAEGGGNPATAPGITLPIGGYLVVWYANYWDPGNVTAPTGFTNRYNPTSGTGLHVATMLAGAGATGDATSVPPGSPWATGLISIAPLVVAGTGGIGTRFDDWF
jgi:hypothetical protein